MSQEIKNRLDQYVQQGQALLSQLHRLKTQRVDVGREIGKAILTEGAAAVAADFFESWEAGRLGRKVTKAFLDQKEKEQLTALHGWIENRHDAMVQSIKSFLSSVSIKRRNLKEPNSSKLVAKMDKAQEYVKIETRIRRTIMALKSIKDKSLIYNKDIPARRIPKEAVVPPGKPFTASMRLKEILKSSKGYVNIIDPYIDETTLEYLLSVPERVPIKLLTAFTGGEEKERRLKGACKKFRAERPQFQTRKCQPGLIHDRFILTQTQGWNIGSSLKDLGKKLSIITEMSIQSKTRVDQMFEKLWNNSVDLIP